MNPSLFAAGATVLFVALSNVGPAVAQVNDESVEKARPAVPEATNFNFIRGVLRRFEPNRALSITSTDQEIEVFEVNEKTSFINQAGKPVDVSAVEAGVQVTITAIDPEQSQARSIAHKVVLANPMKEGTLEKPIEGLVIKMRDAENAITIKPKDDDAENISVLYDEAETEFVGGDGLDVDEEQVEAGDRILVYFGRQQDGGFMAERVVFLGGSGEPAEDDGLLE